MRFVQEGAKEDMTVKTASRIRPNMAARDRTTGARVYVLRRANGKYWEARYPDGHTYTVHESELEPADD